jgi:acetyl coenzyme A synthetase (ADP forming)-like protein
MPHAAIDQNLSNAQPDGIDVVLRDGSTAHLRPARSGDRAALNNFYQQLSLESRYFRFFGKPRVDTVVDDVLHAIELPGACTLVGEIEHRIVAIGQYFPTEVPGRAEAAFAISDAHQGRGIGTKLLERLGIEALKHGITTFEAYFLHENNRMRTVFADAGFGVTWERVDGQISRAILSLEPSDQLRAKAAARSRAAAHASLSAFFRPQGVAVVGAGRRRGRIGAEIFHNLIACGYRGRVVPVNPSGQPVEGVPSVPRVTDIEGDISLAVIAVPCAQVESVVDDCLAKGVKALLIISAGFSETGAAGREVEAAIVEKVRAAGVRLIGPNCMGIINTEPAVRLNATFSPVYPPEGRVAFSTQSGALGLAILDYAARLHIGMSTFASIGNKADVSGNDLIQYWADDPNTDIILLYLESFGNPRTFSELARDIGRQKPIVAVKAGRSAAGARAASSHTGALASSDVIVEALFRHAGVIRTYTLEEMFDVAALLAHQPIPAGRRVAVLTNAGGPAILAADACEANGLELPQLGASTRQALWEFLPAAASVGNPIDMLASAPPEHYERATRLLLADDAIDSLVTIFIPPLVTDPKAVAESIVRGAAGACKPVLATFMSAQGAPPELQTIPCYMFPEAAATALARVVTHGEWRRRPRGTIPVLADIRIEEARAIVGRAADLSAGAEPGGGWLAATDVHAVLRLFGIASATPVAASTEEETVRAAHAIGFPVAMKAFGPTIVHKTDVGGIALDLADDQAVRRAYRDMRQRLGDRMSGVVLQAMVLGGVEMLVGSTFDPTFGPVIACGTGGTLVELFHDVAVRLHPLTDVDAAEMVNELRGAALLRGYRGAAAMDEAALHDVLLRVSALIAACPDIQELDINPLKVLPAGACAIDARIRVGRVSKPVTRRVTY